jgi:dolichol kinase
MINTLLGYMVLPCGGLVILLIIWLFSTPFIMLLLKPRQIIEPIRRLLYFFTPALGESRRLQDEKQTEQSLPMLSCVGLMATLMAIGSTCGLIYVICNAMWQVTPH